MRTRWAIRLGLVAALAITVAACASSAADEAVTAAPPSTVAPTSAPTTTSTAPTTTAAPSATTVDPPGTTAPHQDDVVAVPAPAAIEVRYVGSQAAHVSASLAGPDGARTSPVDGAVTFSGLADGSYDVTVSLESSPTPPTDGIAIGTATTTINAGTLTVAAGDHGVVSCDDTACTAVL